MERWHGVAAVRWSALERWRGGREEGQRSRDKVSHYHHHVLHVGHLGHSLHVPHVGHLAQCYCFLSILYNWANAIGGEELR